MAVRLPLTFVAVALALPALAGCFGATQDLAPAPDAAEAPRGPTHVLAGTSEPAGLAAPTFKLLGAVAEQGPNGGAGEPSVWAALDGSLWVAFPGCDQGRPILTGPIRFPDPPRCEHGLVWRSLDNGTTWTRLNHGDRSRLTDDGPAANGDADVAVDAAGTVYATNLGRGIQAWRSDDRGDSWTYLGNLTPAGDGSDRQWMAAGAPGHLLVTWRGNHDSKQAVAVNMTRDGGRNWTGTQYVGDAVAVTGPVALAPDGEHAYFALFQSSSSSSPVEDAFKLLVARSADGGAHWDLVDPKVTVATSGTGGHWSGGLIFPALDVTGDGHVVVAWSQETLDPSGVTSLGAEVRMIASGDEGATWSAPVALSARPSAVFPWVTGGAGDRAAVTYFASDTPIDTDTGGVWDVEAVVADGVGGAAPDVVRTVIDRQVHRGGICARGTQCTGSDRILLDFFESDLAPDGRLVVVYPADAVEDLKTVQIRFAAQDGGTPLLAPASAGP